MAALWRACHGVGTINRCQVAGASEI